MKNGCESIDPFLHVCALTFAPFVFIYEGFLNLFYCDSCVRATLLSNQIFGFFFSVFLESASSSPFNHHQSLHPCYVAAMTMT